VVKFGRGLVIALLSATLVAGSQQTLTRATTYQSTLTQIKVESPEKDFPIRSVLVLTPAVPASQIDTLPVVYMLHGWPGSPQGLVSGVRSALETAFAQGLQPFIAVFPDGNALTHSDSEWADSYDGKAMIETWLTTNVIKAVEGSNVRSRDNRAIFGFSMGGYGAAIIGLHHPDLYGQVITLAGYFVIDDLTNAFGSGAETDKKHLYQNPTHYLSGAKKMRWFLGESKFDYTTLIRGQAASWGSKLKSVKASYALSTSLDGGHSYTFVQNAMPLVTKWLKWNLPTPPVEIVPQPTPTSTKAGAITLS
jgi:S-formylglutathione hydrolase FrmB